MRPQDVRISRLTRNLINFSEEVAAFNAAQTKHYATAIADARSSATTMPLQTTESTERKRAAVVSWDLCHNPAGRAYVLYELLKKDWQVDLIGPMWSRYGTELWAPLRDSHLNVRSFHCTNISDFVPKAEALAAGCRYDIVYVCKPRLPSLYLGALIKQSSECPMVLDVDDFELSFFKNENDAGVEELNEDLHAALHEPFEELATRYAQTLIPAADAITVSNAALRSRFGGHMVRHARDEDQFINSEERRHAARQRLGITAKEFALIFVGTPRRHKGIIDVAKALQELDDPDIVFHIVGNISDGQLKKELLAISDAKIRLHPDCAFNDLPDILAGADLVPLMQDLTHAVSQYQMPAKVSDALSLGIPVVATDSPPLRDLIASGAIHQTNTKGLAKLISSIKAQANNTERSLSMNQQRRNFVSELGIAVNRTRLSLAVAEAKGKHRQGNNEVALYTREEREQNPDQSHCMPAALARMIAMLRDHYRGLRCSTFNTLRLRRGEVAKADSSSRFTNKLGRAAAVIGSRTSTYDIAYFWKQNDSNLYGRRSDMIAQELVRSGRVGKLMHFDAPVSLNSISDQFLHPGSSAAVQQELITCNLVDRQLGVFDTTQMRNRTHVFSCESQPAKFMGTQVFSKGAYVRYVNEQLEAHGMRAKNTIAWFCPVIWDGPELIEKIGFRSCVVDLIDDQRAWNCDTEFWHRLDDCYRETLAAADLVFANCDSLAEAMQEYARSTVHVVPNGAERFNQFADGPVPDSLSKIPGPIAGYVGNLRDRIDWTMLHEVVVAMPDVSFVFFGPSDNNANATSLAKHNNVYMPGVVRYEELAFHLKCLDVGIVPHLHNQLTERMNPLKIYNYFAAGLPIVSSEVANIESLGNSLRVASTADDFIAAIRASLENPVDTDTAQWQATMDEIAWDSRVEKILKIMDQSLHRKLRKSA